MSQQVEFNDQHSSLKSQFRENTEPTGLVKRLISTGVVKNPKTANKILIVFIIVTLLISALIFYKANYVANQPLTPEQMQELQIHGQFRS